MNNWVFNDKNAGRTQSKSRGQEKEEEGKKKRTSLGRSPGRAQIGFHSFDQFIARRPFARQETSLIPESEHGCSSMKREQTRTTRSHLRSSSIVQSSGSSQVSLPSTSSSTHFLFSYFLSGPVPRGTYRYPRSPKLLQPKSSRRILSCISLLAASCLIFGA